MKNEASELKKTPPQLLRTYLIPEAAKSLNLGITRTRELIWSGELGHVRVTPKRIVVTEEQIQEFLRNREVKPLNKVAIANAAKLAVKQAGTANQANKQKRGL
jgi:hypothetical protein